VGAGVPCACGEMADEALGVRFGHILLLLCLYFFIINKINNIKNEKFFSNNNLTINFL